MKGIKRFVSLIMVILIVAMTHISSFALESNGFALESNGISYEIINGTSTVKITSYTGETADFVVPDTLGGRTVVEIGESAFETNENIKTVTISSNVLRIMKGAFRNCRSIESVIIPASVYSIGDSAFYGCESLKSVAIDSASTTIGYYAFENCTALESVSISSSKIGYAAFRNCTALNSIDLAASVQSVGRYSFDGTAWYNSQSSGSLMLNNVFYAYTGNDSSVVVPDGITCIADYAFSNTNVSSVIIPDGVYYIGNQAFFNCHYMNYISVPSSVISIDTKAIGFDSDGVRRDFTVYCYSDSTAKTWAEENNVSYELIDACTHEYSDWVVTTPPTCTQSGEQYRRCMKCNNTESAEMPSSGHSWSGFVDISTKDCTTPGIQRRTCIVCGETEDNITPAAGHTWDEWVSEKEATCTLTGERSHSCTVCGVSEKEEIPATGHKWVVDEVTDNDGWIVNTPPTCEAEGQKKRTCPVCGETEEAVVPAIGHQATEWTVIKDPTTVTTGVRESICEICGQTFTSDIPVLEEELPDSAVMLTLREEAVFSINSSRTCVVNVPTNIKVSDFRLQFNYSGHVIVSDIDLEIMDADRMTGTGCFVFLARYNSDTQMYDPIDTMCIIITGDLNGDGAVTSADARTALRNSAGLETLNDAYKLAGDIDSDGTIVAAEARKILRVSAELETF